MHSRIRWARPCNSRSLMGQPGCDLQTSQEIAFSQSHSVSLLLLLWLLLERGFFPCHSRLGKRGVAQKKENDAACACQSVRRLPQTNIFNDENNSNSSCALLLLFEKKALASIPINGMLYLLAFYIMTHTHPSALTY